MKTKLKQKLKRLFSLTLYENMVIGFLRLLIISPFLFFKNPIRALKKISNGASRTYKKLTNLETYENALVGLMHFFMKRNPVFIFFAITSLFKKNFKFQISNFKSISNIQFQKFNQRHPFVSTSTSIFSYLLIIGAASWFLFTNYFTSASAWWNDDWHYRKPLTINSSQVTADLTNFPILVSITDGDLASNAQADGDDIVFTLNQGNKLDHEIESFDSSTGTLVAWVRIPQLDGDNDSTIYMYYGNPTTDNQQRAESVWDEDFKIVQHLNEDGTGTRYDSTRNNNDGGLNGADGNEAIDSGKIGGAHYNEDGEAVTIADQDNISGLTASTVSGWINADSFGVGLVYPLLFGKSNYSDNREHRIRLEATTNIVHHISNDGNDPDTAENSVTLAGNINVGSWHYVVGTFDTNDSSTLKLYIDGSLLDTDTGETGPIFSGSADFGIGGYGDVPSGAEFLGYLDEVRFANTARTLEWIQTEFNNQNSPSTFLTVGTQEKGPGPVLYLPFDEGFGTTAHDESSAHNDATISGATWADESMCKNGKCLQFDGNDYLEIDDDNTLDLTNEMTMEAWVKPTSTDRENQTIIAKTETPTEPTKIYRSVGPSATTAITTGASNAMTITGTTAKFASALPTNVGVGDAIQYDDDNDGDIDTDDSLAFITGRISNTQYTISNAAGGVPTAVSADTDWSLFRAYTSLADWESGTENTGIDADLRDFDAGNRDIATNNEQWNIACYANGTTADSTIVDINGWTTDEESYIKVFTPTEFSEVGVTQRHSGVWDDNKYHLSTDEDNDDSLLIQADFTIMDGLQVEIGGTVYYNYAILSEADETTIRNNIVRKDPASTANDMKGIGIWPNSGEKGYIYNNIVYDFDSTGGDGSDWCITGGETSAGYIQVYNNTVQNCVLGYYNDYQNVVLKNNIAQDCVNSFQDGIDSFHPDSTHNLSDIVAGRGVGEKWATGTTTSTTANKLVDSEASFLTDGVQIGSLIRNDTDTTYTYVTAIDSETTLSVNDDYFVSGEDYDVYTNKYGSVTFKNEGSDDFRLAYNDTLAIDGGVDLSADPDLAFTTDIEGDPRSDLWNSKGRTLGSAESYDVGADEYVPTRIYRSVGPGSTTALATGEDNPMTIVGTTVSFAEALDDQVGVGDAIQYDDDDDGDIDSNDSIVFIVKRLTSSEFRVNTASGGVPTAVQGDTDWSLFRAYTSLANAESGTENTGIDSDLRNFDGWGGGRDLVTNDEQWNIVCYANGTTGDTDQTTISGWTTGVNNYIHVYTPVHTSEVGESQRHQGAWDDNKYYVDKTATGAGIYIEDEHARVVGLQIYVHTPDSGWSMHGVHARNQTSAADVRVSNCVMKYAVDGGATGLNPSGIKIDDDDITAYLWNNILYDFMRGIYVDYSATDYIYNNSIVDSLDPVSTNSTGIYRHNTGTVIAKNNIIYDFYDGFNGTLDSSSTNNITDNSAQDGAFGTTHSTGTTDGTTASKLVHSGATFVTDGVQVGSIVQDTSNNQYSYVTAIDSETTLSVNDDIFVSGEGYEVYTNLYGSVDFVDESGDDFHLDTTDTLALEQGKDLSNDPYIKITDDIDGDTREGNWSIGADEGTPTKIYRSVGPGNTTALATDENHSKEISVTSGVATFSASLPDKIGVGDAVLVDTGGTANSIDASDTLLFIHGRNSSTSYDLKTHTGAVPADISTNDTYQIYRAYTSLFNAEAGTKNTSIPIAFNGGNRDIATNGEQWNIACYGDAVDTSATYWDGWETSRDNFIKVYTPYQQDEVGISQRHQGTWDSSKYNMRITTTDWHNDHAMYLNEDFMKVEGVQAATSVGGIRSDVLIEGGLVEVSHCIVRGISGSEGTGIGTYFGGAEDFHAWNNVIYDMATASGGAALLGYSSGEILFYNNTVVNCGNGIRSNTTYDPVVAKNNIIDSCTLSYFGEYDPRSDFNATDRNETPTGSTGTHNKVSQTFSFRDEANDDFRLSTSDTAARGAGVNLYNDENLPVTIDIDGDQRPNPSDTSASQSASQSAVYDIGADQTISKETKVYSMSVANSAPKVEYNDSQFSTGQYTLEANRWNHLVYKRDSSNEYLFINGTQRDTGTISDFLKTNTGKLYIGSQNDGSDNSFQGFIDEVRIYNYARTADEIRKDTAQGSAGKAAARAAEGVAIAIGGEDQGNLSDGLVGYWKMDETTGTDVLDYSGSNNHGTLTNAQETGTAETASSTTTIVDADNTDLSTTDDAYNGMIVEVSGGSCGITAGTTRTISDYTGSTKTITVPTAFSAEADGCTFTIDHQVGGKFGSDVSFDGVDDEVEIDDAASLEGMNDLTMSAWINPLQKSGSTNLVIVDKNYSSAYRLQIYDPNQTDGAGFINGYINGISVNGAAISTLGNTWVHAMIVYDNDYEEARTYINGNLVNTTSVVSNAIGTNSDSLKIGNSQGTQSFNGLIDEVRIYNRALSANEVRQLYKWAPGPVAYWKMDEKVAGDAQTLYDTSGNENNGTTEWGTNSSGMDCTALGKYGNACEFDGTDDYVETICDDNCESAGGMSVFAWVKSTNDESSFIVSNSNSSGSTGYGWGLSTFSNKELALFFYDSAGNRSPDSGFDSGVVLNDGTWHHAGFVYNGSQCMLYQDGILRNTGTCSGYMESSYDVIIGRQGSSLANYWNGLIDDVKVYNYARTGDQIIEDMNAGHPVGGSPVGSQVAYWKFDEGVGGTAYDSAGGNDGTLTPGTGGINTTASQMWSMDAKYGKAIEFDGNDDYIDAGDDASLEPEQITLSAWVKIDSYDNALISKTTNTWGDYTQGYIMRTESDDNSIYCAFGNGTSGISISHFVIASGEWHHVACTWDTQDAKLYHDGEYVRIDNNSGTGALGYTGVSNLRLSGHVGNANADYNGSMDEVKIYSTALTAEQVRTEYNQGKSLVMGSSGTDPTTGAPSKAAGGEYCVPGDTSTCDPPILELKMDEKSGTTAYDTSGNGNDGTLNGSPEWKRGKFGSALSFGGTDVYVDSGSASELDDLGPLSISAWIYPRQSGSGNVLYKATSVISTSIGGWYLLHTNNKIQFGTAYDTAGLVKTTPTVTFTPNQWYHVGLTWDGSSDASNVKIYKNGQELSVEPGTDGSGSRLTDASGNFYVGNRPNLFNLGFDGIVDNIKIYDYARTPAQIAWDYNKGGPVGWWKMDEASGTQVDDWSGNANHGTMTNMDPGTDRVSGKFGGALDFDGSNDYASVGDVDSTLDMDTNDFTMTAWVKRNALGQDVFIVENRSSAAGYGFWINDSGNDLNLVIRDSDDGSYDYIGSGYPIVDQNWHHVAAVLDRDDVVIFYVDGIVVDDTDDISSHSASLSNDSIFTISSDGASYSFSGILDDVRLYNYALTETQIKDVMNSGAVNFR